MVSFDDLIPKNKTTSSQRYAAEEAAKKAANEKADFLSQFGRGVKSQAARFALGSAELANNLTGDRLIDPEVLALAQHGADVIDRGTGTAGFIGNVAGDPLTWMLGGVGGAGVKGAKTTAEASKALAKAGALTGGISGALQPTGDENSNLLDNAFNSIVGAGGGYTLGRATPYVGAGVKKGANMAGGFIDRVMAGAGSDAAANRVAYKNIAEVLKNQGYAPSEVASIIDDFRANGIKGGTLGQMLESSDLLTREKNLLQGGGVAGRIMQQNLKAQPELVSKSLNEKLGGIYQPETTSYLYNKSSEFASVPTVSEKAGAVTQKPTTAAQKYLAPAVDDVEKMLNKATKQIPASIKNRVSAIIDDMRTGTIGVDKGKQLLDGLYIENPSDAQQKIINELVLPMRKTLNSALEIAGGEPYAAAKIAAESDRVVKEALDAFDTTNVGSLKTALNKFYGSPEKQREFLDKLPNEAVRKEFEAYLANLQKIAGKFGGSDTASNQATQKAMNAASGFGVEGDVSVRGLLDKISEPISKNVRKAQAEATFNPDVDAITGFMRGKSYKPGVITKSVPQASIRVPALASQSERDSSRPRIVRPKQIIPNTSPRSEAPTTNVMSRIAQAESGGNPNAKNPNSSASGLFQFTNDTWNASVQRWGKELGIKHKDKNNPKAQAAMAQKLADSNAAYIEKKMGIKPDDGQIYLAHFMGAPAAVKLMKNYGKRASAAQIFPKEAKANQNIFFDANGRARTIEQVYDIITNKVRVG